ncbi:hypothetical protein [Candidatus Electronema sp. JC]|uniref:hypothetical protein n=1 Tax=Candidatus Electronema sp. JC TaxID=3401570 RepID=UPI003AA93D7F
MFYAVIAWILYTVFFCLESPDGQELKLQACFPEADPVCSLVEAVLYELQPLLEQDEAFPRLVHPVLTSVQAACGIIPASRRGNS